MGFHDCEVEFYNISDERFIKILALNNDISLKIYTNLNISPYSFAIPTVSTAYYYV